MSRLRPGRCSLSPRFIPAIKCFIIFIFQYLPFSRLAKEFPPADPLSIPAWTRLDNGQFLANLTHKSAPLRFNFGRATTSPHDQGIPDTPPRALPIAVFIAPAACLLTCLMYTKLSR